MSKIDELFDHIERRWNEIQSLPIEDQWEQFASLWDPFCEELHSLGYGGRAFEAKATPAQQARMKTYRDRMVTLLHAVNGLEPPA